MDNRAGAVPGAGMHEDELLVLLPSDLLHRPARKAPLRDHVPDRLCGAVGAGLLYRALDRMQRQYIRVVDRYRDSRQLLQRISGRRGRIRCLGYCCGHSSLGFAYIHGERYFPTA